MSDVHRDVPLVKELDAFDHLGLIPWVNSSGLSLAQPARGPRLRFLPTTEA